MKKTNVPRAKPRIAAAIPSPDADADCTTKDQHEKFSQALSVFSDKLFSRSDND